MRVQETLRSVGERSERYTLEVQGNEVDEFRRIEEDGGYVVLDELLEICI